MKKSTAINNRKLLSMNMVLLLVLITAMSAAFISGCSSDTETSKSQDSGKLTVEKNEHERESVESSDETDEGGGSEESGNELTLSETYDVVRNGVRLIMNYDKKSNSFKGIMENTTDNTLTQVRIEVHLSNGIELGPTTPIDLTPGEKVNVTLAATSQAFDGWTAHAEVDTGSSEGGGEHDGEDGREGSENGGEHGTDGD